MLISSTSGQAKVRERNEAISVIIKGKNSRKPHTVRYWVDGKQRERSFATAGEARDFKIKTDHDVRAQIFVDGRSGRENFGEAVQTWLGRLTKSEGTKIVYGNVFNAHVKPALGGKTLAQVANAREAVSQLLTGAEFTLVTQLSTQV
jgi:hypothetical protein